jgi:hypothetical protein
MMNATSADEIGKLSARLRLVRIPLIGLVAMNSCLLWVVPGGKGRSEVAVEGARPAVPAAATPRVPAKRRPAKRKAVASIADDRDNSRLGEKIEIATPEPEVSDEVDAATDQRAELPADETLAAEPALAPTPPEVVLPRELSLQDDAAPCIILENADPSGTPVGYLVDGEVHWLAPGQHHALPGDGPHQVVFHRGGDFDDAHMVLEPGHYHFRATAEGWTLDPATAATAHGKN